MSRPGTANSDLEAVQARIEALKEGLLESPPEQDDVRKLFTVVSYVDEVEVAVRALWGTLSTPAKMYDNALCSQTEYRTVILAILTVVGVPPTTLTTLAHRVQQLDSIGAEPIPYKTFKRRITTTIKTLWPQAGPYSAHLESGQPDPTRLLEHEQVGLLASQISDGGSLIASEDLKTFASRGIDCASLTGMCSSLIRPMGCEENGIIIIGDPCVGKTALGAAVAEALNAVHLEVVTLAYNEMQRGSELGGFIADQLREGSPLEMSLQAELISNEMQGAAVRARGFVFDDFPILPCSASGDLMLSKWLDWCNVKPNAVHVLSITAHDSTSLADEWKHLFSQKKRHLREISDTEASLRSEEDAKSAIEAAKLEKRAEIAALKEANPDAEVEELEEEEEVSEEDRAKNEAILLASRKRRTMYDLAALVHTGRMVWLKEGEGDDAREASATDSWEGDTPFLSPASHVELAASIESAVARGTFHEVSHIDSIEDKLSLLFNRYGCFKRAEAPYIPNLSQPEADLLTETEENIEASLMEVLAPQKITFSPVWGKLCPVTYDEGVAVEGTALLPCVMQATLYIFTSRERRAAFIVNPDAYLAAQPKMKNRSMMVLATKPNLMKTHFPANDASLADEALRRLDYACISLDEFHSTWKHYNEMEAGKMFDHVTKQRDLAQKLLEEEELAKTILKAQKKKKGADEKKKKKKGDKKEEKVEAEEADEVKETPDLAEEKELTVLDLKAKEVAAAAHLLKNDSSLLMDALTPDAAQLCYLQSLHLLPSTVVVLDDTPPGTEDEDPEEPPPEEEDPEGVEGGAPPEDTSDPSDLTNPKRYKQFMKDFLASLEQEDEGTPEEAAPTDDEKAEKAEVVPKLEDFYPKQPKKTVRVERINVADLSSVVEVLGVISKRLDVFVPKAVPAEGGEEEGETGGDPDEEDNTPVKDKRLTPGETAEARCGYSVKHCPVSLAADRSLVVGDPEISAIYEGKRWYFKSDVERTKFLEFPKKYSKKVCTLEEGLPPPAFWLVGTQVAETTPFCDSLEELFNVPRIDFRDIDGITERLKAVKKPCSEVQKAAGLLAERKAMEAEADRKQKEKEAILKRQEEDGNADEMPPELEEFEPEDPEVRAERILLSQIAILKHIIRAAPYTNSGHILSNVPTKDEHLDALRDSGIRPEIVIFANLDKDVYIRRRLAVELPARREVYSAKVKHRDESKAGAEQRKKERELYAWRRRNIGGEEAEEDGGEEEEEVVPVSEEELREELGAAYDEELAELEAVRAKATEFRSEVLSVDFATPPDATLSVAMLTLRRRLTYRTSLLCTPYLTTHQDADARIHTSRATLSAFGRNVCPVSHYIMQRKLSTLAKTLGTPPNRTSKFPVLAAQNVVFDMAEASVLDPNCKVEENGGGGKVEGDGEEEEEEAVEPEVEEGDDADDPEAAERARSAAVAANEAAVRERRGVLPYPVLFDGVAYYCANEENVLAFLDHPMRYVEEQLCTPLHVSCNPVLSLREDVPTAVHEIPVLIAIVGSKEDSSANTEDAGGLDGGAPVDVVKDGDEAQREFLRIRHAAAEPSVGEHIAHNLGLVCITKENLIQTFIEKDTTLADILLEKVLKKQDIPESLLVTLIFMRLAMSDVKTKGCILDGVITSMGIAERLDQEISSIATVHNFFVCNDPNLHKWGRIYGFYQDYYRNVTVVPKLSMISQVALILGEVEHSISERRNLSTRRFRGEPALLRNAAQPETSIANRLSKYGEYCCHQWVLNRILVECKITVDDHRARLGAVPDFYRIEHGNQVFCFSTLEGVEHFLSTPMLYEDRDDLHSIQVKLPHRMTTLEAEGVQHFDTHDWENPKKTQWEFKSFCPVTLYETRDKVGLMNKKKPTCVFGTNEFAVQVEDKHYRMASQECVTRFMQSPWVFIEGAALPERLPIPHAALFETGTVSLPNFIKEALYDAVVRAMLDAGASRPGFPGVSSRNSAIRYLAAHLRAHNPANTPLRERVYKKNFESYKQACLLTDFFLGKGFANATEEEKNKNTALWQDIREKKITPQQYEKFNID